MNKFDFHGDVIRIYFSKCEMALLEILDISLTARFVSLSHHFEKASSRTSWIRNGLGGSVTDNLVGVTAHTVAAIADESPIYTPENDKAKEGKEGCVLWAGEDSLLRRVQRGKHTLHFCITGAHRAEVFSSVVDTLCVSDASPHPTSHAVF